MHLLSIKENWNSKIGREKKENILDNAKALFVYLFETR